MATLIAAGRVGTLGPGRALTPTGRRRRRRGLGVLAFLLTAAVFLLVGLVIPPDRSARGTTDRSAWGIVGALLGRATS